MSPTFHASPLYELAVTIATCCGCAFCAPAPEAMRRRGAPVRAATGSRSEARLHQDDAGGIAERYSGGARRRTHVDGFEGVAFARSERGPDGEWLFGWVPDDDTIAEFERDLRRFASGRREFRDLARFRRRFIGVANEPPKQILMVELICDDYMGEWDVDDAAMSAAQAPVCCIATLQFVLDQRGIINGIIEGCH